MFTVKGNRQNVARVLNHLQLAMDTPEGPASVDPTFLGPEAGRGRQGPARTRKGRVR